MAAMTAATGWSLAALVSGLAPAVGDASARPPGAPPQAAAVRALAGGLDADVRARNGGRLLGHLHGHLRASGRGVAVFTPAPRRLLPGDRLDVRARATGARRASVRAGGLLLRLRLTAARDGTLRGRGRLLGRGALRGGPVRIAGVAGDRVPHLRRGLRMLVVGRPHGEGYRTLKRHFRPVRYRPHHTRRYFLRRRRAFHSFGALVFGGHLGRRRIAEHRLLRAFYGAGKWVVAAPAPLRAHRAVGEVHPYVAKRPAPALAVRQVGPRGDTRRVKATVAYPERGPGRPNARQRRESAANRAEFFLSQLRRMAAPHMATAQPDAGGRDGERPVARAAQLSKSIFTLPPNAAAISIMVPVYHDFTMSGSQNVAEFHPCGWNKITWNTWCEDTDWFKQHANGDKGIGCQWLLDQAYDIFDRDTVIANGHPAAEGAYQMNDDDNPTITPYFRMSKDWGDQCPKNATQMGNIQGTDYYFAIFEPTSSPAHTVVAASDLTISATNPPKEQNQLPRLAFQGDNNGRGWIRWGVQETLTDWKYGWDGPVYLKETAWFLGAYDNTFTLTGENVGTKQLEYQSGQSYPTDPITQDSETTGHSTSKSFNVGFFDTAVTGGYGVATDQHADITVNIPNWKVTSAPGSRTITYNWRTNRPVSWDDTIAGGGPGLHDLNPLNITGFAPTSITSWSGDPTWGKVSIEVERSVHMIDHWSRFDRGSAKIVDGGYRDTELHLADGPDDIKPETAAPIDTGINLCDPAVMSPKYLPNCAGLQASLRVKPVCSSSNTSWNNLIQFLVGALPVPAFGAGLSCAPSGGTPPPPSAFVPVGTGSDVDVEYLKPIAAKPVSATCTDQNSAVVKLLRSDGQLVDQYSSNDDFWRTAVASGPDRLRVPASAIKPKTQITCEIGLGPA